jgi:photosystem II stability/assembly factor-like uncharacterized protein
MRNHGRNITYHQRAGVRFGMTRLIGLCLTGALLSIIAARTAGASGEPVSPSQIQSMHLLTTNTGWVAGKRSIALTHDGGQHWVTTASLGGDTGDIESVFFLNDLQGWVVSAFTGEQEQDQAAFIVSSTRDGGTTWTNRQLAVPVAAGGSAISVDFVDAQRGWVMVRKPSSSNFSLGALLETVDGGVNWRLLPDPPIGDAIHFISSTTGWLAGGVARDKLFVTRDGGESWQRQTMSPPGISQKTSVSMYQLPTFRNDHDGTLAVVFGAAGQSSVAVYETHDSGMTWTLSSSVPLSENALNAGGAVTSVVDESTFFVAPRSRDRFTAVTQGVPRDQGSFAELAPDEAVTRLDFKDDSHGWMLATSGHCNSFKSQCSQESRLFATSDGGLTFSELTPPVGANSALSVGDTAISPDAVISISARGFDQCAAGTVSQMQAWWTNTPWSFANIYIGGANRGCSQPSLTSAWVNSILHAQGWGLVPTWVGLQAPGSHCGCSIMSSNTATAKQQGINEANAATNAANALGLKPPTIIYYDLEQYDGSSAAAAAFVEGWVTRLHQLGNQAGVYANPTNAAADLATIANPPDAVWIAAWNGNPSVFGISGLPDNRWDHHQRIHQYQGCHTETWGGVTFHIDSDTSDGPVAF